MRKLVRNMAFNGLRTVSGKPTQEVLKDPQLRERLLAVIAEVLLAATANSADLEPNLIAAHLNKTEAMPSDVPTMLLDARAGPPLELEAIYRVPLARAARHGVAMPETTALLRDLECLMGATASQV